MDLDLSPSLELASTSHRQAARSGAAAGGAFQDLAEAKGVAGNAEAARRGVGEAQAATAEGIDGGTVGAFFFENRQKKWKGFDVAVGIYLFFLGLLYLYINEEDGMYN